MRQPVIVDGRNVHDPKLMAERGFVYRGVGRGVPQAEAMGSAAQPLGRRKVVGRPRKVAAALHGPKSLPRPLTKSASGAVMHQPCCKAWMAWGAHQHPTLGLGIIKPSDCRLMRNGIASWPRRRSVANGDGSFFQAVVAGLCRPSSRRWPIDRALWLQRP